ncbi:MAG TPA: response regulator [Pyrinomonadaceae bacterium]
MVTGRKLLLADDSVTIQKVIDLTFSDEGIEVTTVGNGEQALSKLDELQPDIVLADVFMPGRNGYEVCEHIKRDERYRHIPVMLLVGSFEPFDEAEARRVGADDYLTKPFQSIRQLVNKVTSLISGGGANSEDETSTRDLELPDEIAKREEQSRKADADIYTADTAPLSKELKGIDPAEAAAHLAGHESLDDEMIEARNPNELAGPPSDDIRESQTRPTEPLSSMDLREAGMQAPVQEEPEQLEATERDLHLDEMNEDILSTEPPENNYLSNAAAADEALLDLGEIDAAPVSTREADDFILDLQDDAPAAQAPVAQEEAPPVSGFAQPETSESQPPVEDTSRFGFEPIVAPVADYKVEEAASPEPFMAEEQAGMESTAIEEAAPEALETQGGFWPQTATGSFAGATEAVIEETHPREEATAPSGMEASAPAAAASAESQPPTGQITLDQLAPETIDAIARRVVELLSTRVVEQVAWEVVPQLAELLIKRKLEEEKMQ